MRVLLLAVATASTMSLCLSMLPYLHRSIDSLSILRPIYGLGTLIGVFAARQIAPKLLFSVFGLAALFSTYLSFPASAPGGDLRLYSKNIRYDNKSTAAIHADITEANVDIVMLQEVTETNQDLLAKLNQQFPHQHLCNTRSRGDIGLASRIPFASTPECSIKRSFLVASVVINGEKIHVISLHFPWPWPMNTQSAEEETWDMLETLMGPVVIAGDFNAMPWSERVSRIKTATATNIAGPVSNTLNHRKLPIPLPLDFALAPGGGTVEVRPLLGSDHHGIVADISLRRR